MDTDVSNGLSEAGSYQTLAFVHNLTGCHQFVTVRAGRRQSPVPRGRPCQFGVLKLKWTNTY